MNNQSDQWSIVRQTFQKIWGYENFRSPQGEIIECLLNAQDAIIVIPTGAGKSLCFQLPALLQKGLTLVISPLVALMENQVYELKQKQLPADLLHNEIPKPQRKKTLEKVKKQQIRLLYLSPETLLSPPIWEILKSPELKINGLILDEAHCLVEWGETFRPAYGRLGAVRQALLLNKPPDTKIAIAAFTATADLRTQGIIQRVLQLENPQKFCLSPYRANLNLKVKIAWTPRCRNHQLLNFIQSHQKQSGLIYIRSRRESESLSQWLASLNYKNTAYHAGLSPQQRREIEQRWLEENLQFVVCTSAFGLGINKPNVRWVVHFQAPFLLSEYLQEIGRGGRDGKKTDNLTLISEPTGWLDSSDQQKRQYFLKQLEKQYQQAKNYVKRIPQEGNIQDITQEIPQGEIILSLLHRWGQLQWLDPFHYRLKSSSMSVNLAKIKQISQQASQQMNQYLMTRNCRWQYLLNAFGFPEEAKGWNCGHCDNCRRH
ncbi:RecQ family ATP-dependent DNA helicase [Crocosphaera sp. UHCC 0190]|uniref:RecQ family ATP-dependent DNA helicase n=1 Tax=Crocosphaera sp. UHCC 0190 TaxID=3110246 RepID=UPI002B217667|nr:RecQ family ATP-dependent DNA helicase [Crocosphaera sp. UHCC 0190]MEA5509709.1 RecQ family ATP-dependent DNA helicase [Crocosphaera sp. UHCC 0190]